MEENLDLAALSADDPLSHAEIYATFPRLRERSSSYGRSLSGGEQQMLAIARALISASNITGYCPIDGHML